MSTTNYWQGSIVRLRAFEPTDAETFYLWNLDSERARMLDFVWPPTSKAALKELAEQEAKRKPEDDCFNWVIETCEGTPVGTICTHHCNQHWGTFSYGVDVAQEHRGNGYAAAAIKLVLRYFFEELRYQKCTVQIHSDNLPCIRLHEKLGYQHEGTLRRMMYTHGQYLDERHYGITAEEFETLKG